MSGRVFSSPFDYVAPIPDGCESSDVVHDARKQELHGEHELQVEMFPLLDRNVSSAVHALVQDVHVAQDTLVFQAFLRVFGLGTVLFPLFGTLPSGSGSFGLGSFGLGFARLRGWVVTSNMKHSQGRSQIHYLYF